MHMYTYMYNYDNIKRVLIIHVYDEYLVDLLLIFNFIILLNKPLTLQAQHPWLLNREGIFIVPHLLWQGASFPRSHPPRFVAIHEILTRTHGIILFIRRLKTVRWRFLKSRRNHIRFKRFIFIFAVSQKKNTPGLYEVSFCHLNTTDS